ncbi:hypothetical protein BHYA_0262g00040 [Botrytis hyacinthi]|uniref:Uncharacterized protein n=1 Tax=Botrytis hyacinthi TaxID=278943 RepID=A0A4Z1GGX6_9HELO|nr:hypothetical protein BHYA_0262g00040 [Botrytis hyacinthi]
MPRFIQFQIDWPIHAKLNNDVLDQSAHGKNETPIDCICDLCYEQFCIASVDEEYAAQLSSNCDRSSAIIAPRELIAGRSPKLRAANAMIAAATSINSSCFGRNIKN